MPRFRCKTCRGEYDDEIPGRTPYFHRCPPDVFLLVRNPAGQDREIPRFAPIPPGHRLIDFIQRERPNERDETLVPDPSVPARVKPRREGLGREPV